MLMQSFGQNGESVRLLSRTVSVYIESCLLGKDKDFSYHTLIV